MSDNLLEFPGEGVDYDMPAETYHRIKALSKSTAEAAVKSPAHWWAKMRTPEDDKEKKSRRVGSALHVAVLEPGRFDSLYVAAPALNKNSNAWKDWLAENADRKSLDPVELDSIHGMAKAIRRDPVCMRLMSGSKTEVSMFWHDQTTGVPCKARIDIASPIALADPKTTDDAGEATFTAQASKMRYHCQEAHYRNGWWKLHAEDLPFFFIAVETKPPHGLKVYETHPDTLSAGREWMGRAAEAFLDVLDSGDNPRCYTPGVHQLYLPAWASR